MAADTILTRFAAGGGQTRAVIVGALPDRLVLPDLTHFALLVQVSPGAVAGAVVADAAHLPFAEALFDTMALASPLNDARAALREAWRVLAPAGTLLLIVPARRPWQRQRHGWRAAALHQALRDAMFETLETGVMCLPARHHLVFAAKRDGLAPIVASGATMAAAVPAVAAVTSASPQQTH